MSDEPRDQGPGEEEAAEEGGPPDAPAPRTWAGRAQADQSESGLTDEFDGLEAELSADLDDLGTDEKEPEEQPDQADELEEPPAEFEFEDDEAPVDEDDEEPEGDGEPEAGAGEPSTRTGQETVEADALAIADREAEHEAAHAGLRARAEKTAAERVGVTGGQADVAGAVAAVPTAGAGEPPKRTIGWRFLAASFVIVGSIASATAIAFLLYLTDIGDALGDEKFSDSVAPSLAEVEGGDPQTILILGSDKRTTAPGDPGRSDTTMLLRVDPDKRFLALLSLPRDLMVEIPGYGTDKLNAAYNWGEQFEGKSGGGSQLTLRTVKELLGIDINHIVNVNFEGFYDAINAIGGVYVDIDRHYFNPVGGEYDDIDIEAGYTKLDGYRALDYVRYRHNDNDLVRGARQQAFVREARQQIPPRDLLPFLPGSSGDELIDIFTKYTTSDIDDAPTIIEMLRSFVEVRSAPVRQLTLGELAADGGVDASNDDIEATVDQFLGNDLDAPEAVPAEPNEPTPGDKPKDRGDKPGQPSGPALTDVAGTAQEYAKNFQNHLRDRNAGLPVFYPTALIANQATAISPESRAHVIEPPDGVKNPYFGYKYVVPYQEGFGLSFYGVTGVNWANPPILNNPGEVRRIDGRDYLLFYEKDRLRLVGWTKDDDAYWVINTLTRALSQEEMLAVATSTREFDG